MSYQTEVISSQPQMTVTSYKITTGSSTWNTDVCDCFDDCGICLCGTFLPCCLGCKVAQDHGESCCVPFLPGGLVALRTSIRNQYGISGSICDDWIVMVCCLHCGLCQLGREQKTRG
ncbi:cornifelin homolog [Sardina pilchardus]|uniref:cornifelin homolog n=1 Tax=Sardina pilchardus TaxID=27697 RepID=UPI002E137694